MWVDSDLVIGHIGAPVIVDKAYRDKWARESAAAGAVTR